MASKKEASPRKRHPADLSFSPVFPDAQGDDGKGKSSNGVKSNTVSKPSNSGDPSHAFRATLRPCSWLRDHAQAHDITLPHKSAVILGRNPLTHIKRQTCSRRQLQVLADLEHGTVTATQLASSPSIVDEQHLHKNQSCHLSHGTSLVLLPNHSEESTFRLDLEWQPKASFTDTAFSEETSSQTPPNQHTHASASQNNASYDHASPSMALITEDSAENTDHGAANRLEDRAAYAAVTPAKPRPDMTSPSLSVGSGAAPPVQGDWSPATEARSDIAEAGSMLSEAPPSMGPASMVAVREASAPASSPLLFREASHSAEEDQLKPATEDASRFTNTLEAELQRSRRVLDARAAGKVSSSLTPAMTQPAPANTISAPLQHTEPSPQKRRRALVSPPAADSRGYSVNLLASDDDADHDVLDSGREHDRRAAGEEHTKTANAAAKGHVSPTDHRPAAKRLHLDGGRRSDAAIDAKAVSPATRHKQRQHRLGRADVKDDASRSRLHQRTILSYMSASPPLSAAELRASYETPSSVESISHQLHQHDDESPSSLDAARGISGHRRRATSGGSIAMNRPAFPATNIDTPVDGAAAGPRRRMDAAMTDGHDVVLTPDEPSRHRQHLADDGASSSSPSVEDSDLPPGQLGAAGMPEDSLAVMTRARRLRSSSTQQAQPSMRSSTHSSTASAAVRASDAGKAAARLSKSVSGTGHPPQLASEPTAVMVDADETGSKARHGAVATASGSVRPHKGSREPSMPNVRWNDQSHYAGADLHGDTSTGGGSARHGWMDLLVDVVRRPERHRDVIVAESDDCIAIRDKFPKARFHLLIMPREEIPNITDLNRSHLKTIENMQMLAKECFQREKEKRPEMDVRVGFHAVPSMRQLHLHVISRDFDSEFLKTKKHWNSFNTSYFLHPRIVYDMLHNGGKVTIDKQKELEKLKRPLRCHMCELTFRTMPALKRHIALHDKET